MAELTLSSPAFDDGERIPDRFGYTEQNVNPPLELSGVPNEAASLVVIVDDPDAREPAGKIWDHWVLWNVDPDVDQIPEDWDADSAGASEGQNDFGEVGWGGPNPPDREHTYRFLLYALDTTIHPGPSAKKDDVYDAAEGHVVGKARLEGTYPP